jgi:hypothetical protein
MPKAIFALLLASLALPAQAAAIYKYVDAEGNVTFTDRYRPGAVKLADTPDGPGTTITAPRKSSRQNGSPASFPKVDKQTQNKRDDVRRTLLLEERGNEEKALAAIRSSLAAGNRLGAAEQARLVENRRLHEKNIEMLDKELARIK